MRKKAWKKWTAVITAVSLVLTGIAVPHGTAAASGMKLNKKKVTLKVGKKIKLKLKNAKKKVTWKSSNKKIASVTRKGVVKGKKPGKAKITAKCKGKKFVCKVTVKRNGTATADSADIIFSGAPAARITNYPAATTVPTVPTVKPTRKPLFPVKTKTPTASAGVKPTASPKTEETKKPEETKNPEATKAPEMPSPSGSPAGTATKEPDASFTEEPAGTADVNLPETTPGTDPSGAPGVTASAQPGSTPAPNATKEPAGNQKGYVSTKTMPASADADTLAVGKFHIRLGMTSDEVKNVMGAEPDYTGTSPQGMKTCMYNPSGDYLNLIEVQFKEDKVAEMSTISAYFRYADIVSSEDTDKTLSGKFSSMQRKYVYEAGYQYSDNGAYITVFSDHQGDGKIYGIQVFDKTLASKLDKLILPQNCSYTKEVASTMKLQMEDYVNAFRVSKQKDPMKVEQSDVAQKQAEYMASVGKNVTSGEGGISWSDRFDASYGETYVATEFTGDSCEDAFSHVVYAIDTTKHTAAGQMSDVYKNMIMEEGPDGAWVDMHLSCGFAYNTSTKLYTFGVIDLFGF